MCSFKNLNNITFLIIAIVIIAASVQELATQQIQSYTSCRLDKNCKNNAFCYGNDVNQIGKCKCVDGFELIQNPTFYECLQGVKLGEECEKDIQCHITASQLAFCNESKLCDCRPEAHKASNGICYLSVGLREICMSDNNCYLDNGKLGYCSTGHCACPLGQKPSLDNTYCITAKKIGEECVLDEECVHSNTRCTDVCRCKTEYVLTRNGTRCVKAATAFGESCSFDDQCSEFLLQSICENETCTCGRGYHQSGIKCVGSIKPGQYCEEDEQCIFESKLNGYVHCTSAVCTCIFGIDSDGICDTDFIDKIPIPALLTLVLFICIYFLFLKCKVDYRRQIKND